MKQPSRQCREQRGDTVSVSYDDYSLLKTRLELLELLAESEEDVRSGRVAPMQETFDDIRSQLQKGKF